MWNVVKIGKSIHHLLTTYGEVEGLKGYQEDLIGDKRLDHVLTLYRELNFPFGFVSITKMRTSKKGRDMIWGRGFNDEKYVKESVIPTLLNYDWLKTLAPNTVGAHYYNLVKDWGLDELYNQRFKPEETREGGLLNNIYNSFSDDIRTSHSRHMLLSHDMWHVLFRYDTSPLGEGMIQTISAQQSHFWPMHIVGFGVSLKESWRRKTIMPFKVWRETLKLGRAASKELILNSPVDFLSKDIEEVRKTFNIGMPVVYFEYVKRFPDDFRMDTIHPEYGGDSGTIEL